MIAIRAVGCVLIGLVCVGASACSSSADETAEPAVPPPVVEAPAVTPTVVPSPTAESTLAPLRPEPASFPEVTNEDRAVALDVERAPLGTFVVAKPNAGIPTVLPPWREGKPPLEIPVYDEPFGDARTLVYEGSNGSRELFPFLQGHDGEAPLVLRVVAGGPGDEWIRVQAPIAPTGQTVWVRSLYFEFGFTRTRIEVDLAGDGLLRLIDGGDIMLESPISAQAPLHVTYVQGGDLDNDGLRLAIGSYSGWNGTRSPLNYLRGVELPEKLPVDLEASDMNIPTEILETLAAVVEPGTPVLIFDSSLPAGAADSVASYTWVPAATDSFVRPELPVVTQPELGSEPLWQGCLDPAGTTCATGLVAPVSDLPVGRMFLAANPDAGQELVGVGNVVPVYDEPGAPKRILVDFDEITRDEHRYPLYNPTQFDQPLVMRLLQGGPGDEWLLVQAPIRPHRQSVWVRADNFEFGTTTTRFEIDIGTNMLSVFVGDDLAVTSPVVSGRDSRPTALNESYVEQAFDATVLNRAYGSYILTLATYSEVLPTFGGGGMPGLTLHGTNQPGLVGQRVSSGGIRVSNEKIEEVYELPGVVGASVVLFSSEGTERVRAINQQRARPWSAARTTTFPQSAMPVTVGHSYT